MFTVGASAGTRSQSELIHVPYWESVLRAKDREEENSMGDAEVSNHGFCETKKATTATLYKEQQSGVSRRRLRLIG